MNLFNLGSFELHSGDRSHYKIDCDALTDGDIECLAYMINEKLECTFKEVHGVPKGGLRLAEALKKYAKHNDNYFIQYRLIVDDVLTTGKSMEKLRKTFDKNLINIGAVIFARATCPDWITPLFRMY